MLDRGGRERQPSATCWPGELEGLVTMNFSDTSLTQLPVVLALPHAPPKQRPRIATTTKVTQLHVQAWFCPRPNADTTTKVTNLHVQACFGHRSQRAPRQKSIPTQRVALDPNYDDKHHKPAYPNLALPSAQCEHNDTKVANLHVQPWCPPRPKVSTTTIVTNRHVQAWPCHRVSGHHNKSPDIPT